MTEDPTDRFTRVLRGLLRPLVRLLIARGVTVPIAYRLLKEVYVTVAVEDFAIDGDRPTDSRVSVLTGVHRRDVKTIREADDDGSGGLRQKTALLTTVVGRWAGGRDTTGQDGKPLPLPRSGDTEPNFEALVREINRDIRPRTVLDELLRLGLVQVDDDGLLVLDDSVLVGSGDTDQQTVFFAENVGDHLAAAAENLMSEEPPFLERAVFYNNLSAASVNEIEARARALSQDTLVELNAMARDRQSRDEASGKPLQRFRFGVYLYREDAEPKTED